MVGHTSTLPAGRRWGRPQRRFTCSPPAAPRFGRASPFSRTLDAVDWNNTRLVKDNIGMEVSQLKQQPGADLAVFGSADLLSTLIQLNLVEEHRVLVNPVVLGRGKPLFTGLSEKLNLQLVDSRTFRSGNVLLTYQPASAL